MPRSPTTVPLPFPKPRPHLSDIKHMAFRMLLIIVDTCGHDRSHLHSSRLATYGYSPRYVFGVEQPALSGAPMRSSNVFWLSFFLDYNFDMTLYMSVLVVVVFNVFPKQQSSKYLYFLGKSASSLTSFECRSVLREYLLQRPLVYILDRRLYSAFLEPRQSSSVGASRILEMESNDYSTRHDVRSTRALVRLPSCEYTIINLAECIEGMICEPDSRCVLNKLESTQHCLHPISTHYVLKKVASRRVHLALRTSYIKLASFTTVQALLIRIPVIF